MAADFLRNEGYQMIPNAETKSKKSKEIHQIWTKNAARFLVI